MAARRNRKRHRRRRGRFSALYKLLSFLIILAAILVGCVAFFRVNQVTVAGNSRYSPQEIIDASEVRTGSNLFLVNRSQARRNILRRLPYVEKVAVALKLPDTLELHVIETSAVAAIQGEESWWLLDAGGRFLESGDETLGAQFPQVTGLTALTHALGEKMTVAAEEQAKLEGLRGLLTALADRGMAGNITGFIDLNSANAIYFGFQEDLTVVVPMSGDFDRRAFSLQRVLETFQQRGEAVTGTLDLTYGDDQARLLTEQWLPGESGGKGGAPDDGTEPEPIQSGQPDDGGQAPEQ